MIMYKSLYDYLDKNIDITDFSIRVNKENDIITGYIYPSNQDGDSIDFILESDENSSYSVIHVLNTIVDDV